MEKEPNCRTCVRPVSGPTSAEAVRLIPSWLLEAGLDWEETGRRWYNVALRVPPALTGLMRAEDSRSEPIQPLVRTPLSLRLYILSCTHFCLHRMPFSPLILNCELWFRL